MDFENKVVVITGASSGIGKETAIILAKKRTKLVLVAQNYKRLKETLEIAQKEGARQAIFLKCDVSDYSQVTQVCKKIKNKFRKIDVLINNAGFGVYRNFAGQDIGEFEKIMKTNFFGTVYFTKELLPSMQKGAHIANISSMAGKLAFPNYSAYCSSKFAVSAFTESLYHELIGKGIFVHLICPIGTKTRFFDNESFDSHPHRVHYDKMMDASKVAELILNAIERNEREVIPTLREKLILILKVLLPAIYHRIMQGNYVKRQMQKGSSQDI